MELYYQGVDIADDVDIIKCVHHEASGGRCDCLEIEMENAGSWYAWGPQTDDEIIAALNGYQTGKLYLNTILPQDGRYRVLATSLPSIARRKSCATYIGMTMRDILASCAAECSMNSAVYGMDDGITYPFLMRKTEGAAAFIDRLMTWEGAAFKAVGGRFAGIDITSAQSAMADQSIELTSKQSGVTHLKRDDMKWAGLTIRTPYAECSAVDDDVQNGIYITMTDLPALDDVQAGRWARGLLLHNNRKAEKLTLSMEFNPGLSAMARIDIDSTTGTDGMWIVDEAAHDFIAGKSSATLLRCIETIR